MGSTPKPIVFDDLRGGRNDTDPPLKLPMNQATEFLNMDWKDATFGRKRGGATAIALTGGTAFTPPVSTLQRHVPGATETAAELWGVDFSGFVKRLAGGTTWADVTLDDAISTRAMDVVGATLNGKLFLAFDSTQDRLHVYDPSLAAPRVRRVGLTTPVFPTVADTAVAGTYTATVAYWRIRWIQINGTTLVRRSEPSASTSFTPSGTKNGVIITRSTAAGEGETHWEVEVSLDNSTFFPVVGFLNGVNTGPAIATTTQTITAAPSTFSSFTVDRAGLFALFPSVKVLISDGNRLLGAGAWETSGATSAGKNSRIWFTPVLGSTDHGDDERIPNTTDQKNWVDINENDGGGVTGLGGPVNGVPWAFKYRQIWKLRPTGDVNSPYLPRKVMDGIGCIDHKSIAIIEDHLGRPALGFMSHRGPYRIDFDGNVHYLGRDNEVMWRSMNLAAVNRVSHSVYYPDLHQWWVWIATGSNNDPDTKMVFDVQRGFPDEDGQIRGGWAKHSGETAASMCSCLFAGTIAASMSSNLKPYVAQLNTLSIVQCDTPNADDNGTTYQAYATTRPVLTSADLTRKIGIGESILVAKATAATSVTVAIERDFGKESRQLSVSVAPVGSETRVVQMVEGSEMGEANVVQMTVGDSAASAVTWTIDALITPVSAQEPR